MEQTILTANHSAPKPNQLWLILVGAISNMISQNRSTGAVPAQALTYNAMNKFSQLTLPKGRVTLLHFIIANTNLNLPQIRSSYNAQNTYSKTAYICLGSSSRSYKCHTQSHLKSHPLQEWLQSGGLLVTQQAA